jgi:hypothetical protein
LSKRADRTDSACRDQQDRKQTNARGSRCALELPVLEEPFAMTPCYLKERLRNFAGVTPRQTSSSFHSGQ